MEKEELLAKLDNYQARLVFEINDALMQDVNIGYARWESWCTSAGHFFEKNLPNYLPTLNTKMNQSMSSGFRLNPIDRLHKYRINPVKAFLNSLILDIKSDDYLINDESKNTKIFIEKQNQKLKKTAFIVHGHDVATQQKTARFLEQIGFEAIILSEKPSKGMTIIEKLEHYIDTDGFGVVLYTPDDEGSVKDKKDYKPRARQNVVFEHGWLIGVLGRKKVIQVVTDHTIELPNDISGVVYLSDKGWELDFMNEIHAMGYDVDYNLLRKS